MTVTALLRTMPAQELMEWIAHDELTLWEREQEMKKQELTTKASGRR